MSVWSSANKICQCLNLAWLHSNSTENSIFSTEWFSFSLPKCHCCVHVICFLSCSGIFDSESFDCTRSVICRICFGSLLFVYSIRQDLTQTGFLFTFLMLLWLRPLVKITKTGMIRKSFQHTNMKDLALIATRCFIVLPQNMNTDQKTYFSCKLKSRANSLGRRLL